MININKGKPIESLLKAKLNSESYEQFRDKQSVKESLLKEQGYLCAYCMSRIDENNTKIEHFIPQSINNNLELDYLNMLAVCKGGEGNPPNKQHCDTRKGDTCIKYNPSRKEDDMMMKIKYLIKDGSIFSDDMDFNTQLNDILNLNLPFLKNNRKAAIDGYICAFNKESDGKHISDMNVMHKKINKISDSGKDGRKKEYLGIILYWLYKKLKRMG